MDILYYNNQIKDELEGAIDYCKRAINCKVDHPEWAVLYSKMSSMELDHASTLLKIFEDDYKASRKDDPLYPALHKSLNDMYAEYAAKAKQMQEIYSQK